MNEARIKLAKVMGIKPTIISDLILNKYSFDPFTDANHDFAVLEWIRSQIKQGENGALFWADSNKWWPFYAAIKIIGPEYKIGDYARAACKVLGIEYV